MNQATSNVLLIRPANFVFNEQTAVSNAFQNKTKEKNLQQKALDEFEFVVKKMQTEGVNVRVFDDTVLPQKPDAVFPNNWVSFHADGTVILYPMCAPNRRQERRMDIIDELGKTFLIKNIIDLSGHENGNIFLEGTGSIVFDHQNKIGYACISPRTDKELFMEVCNQLQYQPFYFYAHDRNGIEIYHTNVLMCIAEDFAVVCLDAFTGASEKEMVIYSLSKTGHEIIDISFDQMNHFAGNMLALRNTENEQLLVLSQTAFNSLTHHQKKIIEKSSKFVPLPIHTIETIGGGSARCMIAEIFLPVKAQ